MTDMDEENVIAKVAVALDTYKNHKGEIKF
jgi:hypothetical protein